MTSSLDRIMAEVAKTYLSVQLDLRDGSTATLRNILLMDEVDRRRATTTLAGLDADPDEFDADVVEEQVRLSRDFLAAVADRPEAVRNELADWPAAALVVLVSEYMEATQAGEA
ncbi:phage tail assembly protein [Kitasatospora sp. NPDC058263]